MFCFLVESVSISSARQWCYLFILGFAWMRQWLRPKAQSHPFSWTSNLLEKLVSGVLGLERGEEGTPQGWWSFSTVADGEDSTINDRSRWRTSEGELKLLGVSRPRMDWIRSSTWSSSSERTNLEHKELPWTELESAVSRWSPHRGDEHFFVLESW